jgi:hypothetical protein
LSLTPDLSDGDAIAILVAPVPAIVANMNWGPRGDFSEPMILSRSESLLLSAKRAGTEGAGGITIGALFAIPDDDCIAAWTEGTDV